MSSNIEKSLKKLSKPQKAALLLIALGQKWATEAMRHLKADEVHKISYWINQTQYVPQLITEHVIREFYESNSKNLPIFNRRQGLPHRCS